MAALFAALNCAVDGLASLAQSGSCAPPGGLSMRSQLQASAARLQQLASLFPADAEEEEELQEEQENASGNHSAAAPIPAAFTNKCPAPAAGQQAGTGGEASNAALLQEIAKLRQEWAAFLQQQHQA